LLFGAVLTALGLMLDLKSSEAVLREVEGISIASKSSELSTSEEFQLVSKVVDGDTIEVSGKAVRLIGIDTPETVHPSKPVECFGKEASQVTKNLLEGKWIKMEKDVSETDKYERLLRYIFLPLDNGNLLFINDYLVREGFALVLTYPPDVKYDQRLRKAEKEARENSRGLWGRCLSM
jgi:micrococcal nuclease